MIDEKNNKYRKYFFNPIVKVGFYLRQFNQIG